MVGWQAEGGFGARGQRVRTDAGRDRDPAKAPNFGSVAMGGSFLRRRAVGNSVRSVTTVTGRCALTGTWRGAGRRGVWGVVFCAVATASLGLWGCIEPRPPSLPRVTVRVEGIGSTPASAFFGDTAVTATLCVRPALVDGGMGGSADGGSRTDAGSWQRCAPGEIQRAKYWDHLDPYVFVVQLPEQRYVGATVEFAVSVRCRDGVRIGPVAYGTNTESFTPRLGVDTTLRFRVVGLRPEDVCR